MFPLDQRERHLAELSVDLLLTGWPLVDQHYKITASREEYEERAQFAKIF